MEAQSNCLSGRLRPPWKSPAPRRLRMMSIYDVQHPISYADERILSKLCSQLLSLELRTVRGCFDHGSGLQPRQLNLYIPRVSLYISHLDTHLVYEREEFSVSWTLSSGFSGFDFSVV